MDTKSAEEGLKLALQWPDLIRALLILIAGFVLARVFRRIASSEKLSQLPGYQQRLVRQLGGWVIIILFATTALHQLGFHLGVLLGAAGVLSVALGFASQTSAANIISGLFVLSERSFQVGDIVTVGNYTGEILSVDLLSVKLRTFDNLFVRIPNETIMKSEVTTLTRFPIRRFDMQIGIAYRAEIGRAREVLMRVAEDNPLCLEEPKPLFILLGFGDSSVNIQFSVWGARENFLDLRNSIMEGVKIAFDEAGIEIPFPHRSLYVGEVTKPLPVQMVGNSGSDDG